MMRGFFATEAAVTNRRRWGGGRECGGRRGRGQHAVRANSAGTPTNQGVCLFVFVSFLTSPVISMRIHSLARVPSKVLASSIHSLAHKSNAWLFIDSVFPVKLAAWESVIHPFLAHLILTYIILVFDIFLAISAKNVFLTHSPSLLHK